MMETILHILSKDRARIRDGRAMTTIKSALLYLACFSLSSCAGERTAGERIADMPHWMGGLPTEAARGSRGSDPRLLGLTMGWLLDRTLGSDPVHQGSSRP